jgi:hypothetical protein
LSSLFCPIGQQSISSEASVAKEIAICRIQVLAETDLMRRHLRPTWIKIFSLIISFFISYILGKQLWQRWRKLGINTSSCFETCLQIYSEACEGLYATEVLEVLSYG